MTAAIIQARTASTRLPGKVLLPAAGKPLLAHLIERLRFCRALDEIIVATSDQPGDEAIADLCGALGVPVFRGSEADVLDRYYRAALCYGVDTVVRICSDCPLLDPRMVDELVAVFRKRRHEFDLVTSRYPMTYPDACDVLSFDALEHAWRSAADPFEREHVVPYFWRHELRVYNKTYPGGLSRKYRWTLDYPEDYELVRVVYAALYRAGACFGREEIVRFFEENPHVALLNSGYIHP